MNEKLEDLMYRAGLTAQGCWDTMDQYDREAIEKFAELIVEEIMQELFINGYEDAFDHLNEHFGVE